MNTLQGSIQHVGIFISNIHASTSETSEKMYQTICRNNPEDRELYTRRLGNVKSVQENMWALR